MGADVNMTTAFEINYIIIKIHADMSVKRTSIKQIYVVSYEALLWHKAINIGSPAKSNSLLSSNGWPELLAKHYFSLRYARCKHLFYPLSLFPV